MFPRGYVSFREEVYSVVLVMLIVSVFNFCSSWREADAQKFSRK